MVLASCSDCAPLCFPMERRARQQRVLLTLGANEQNLLKTQENISVAICLMPLPTLAFSEVADWWVF